MTLLLSPENKNIIASSSFLVTGGAGFIGSHIAECLLQNGAKKVRVLDNLSTGFEENLAPFYNYINFEFVKGDIRDIETCQMSCLDIDYVFHQAALGSVPRSINDPLTTNAVNITGQLNILVACRDQRVKRLIYAASSSTYGDSASLPKKEDIIGKPLSPYAVTKYVNELYADVFYKTYGLESVGLRYFNVFGPRQSPKGSYAAVIPLFIEAIAANKPPYINSDGEQTRDFTYVDNVVEANMLALFCSNKKAINQVFNIAAGERTSLNQLFAIISTLLEKPHLKPIYREGRQGDIRDSLADISKAKTLLGYAPKYSVKEGLFEHINLIKSNYNLQSASRTFI